MPSLDAAERLRTYMPNVQLIVTPHPDAQRFGQYSQPVARPLAEAEPLRIAVLGAIDQVKGADILEQCAIKAVAMEVPVEFQLIGYAYKKLRKRPQANLVVYGKYQESDLRSIIRQVRPHLIWFPARIPETYSYTLSAALELTLPVVAPDLGAFAERLSGRQWSWVVPWNQSPDQWNRFFVEIADNNFRTGVSPIVQPTAKLNAGQAFSYKDDYLAPLCSKRIVNQGLVPAVAVKQL